MNAGRIACGTPLEREIGDIKRKMKSIRKLSGANSGNFHCEIPIGGDFCRR